MGAIKPQLRNDLRSLGIAVGLRLRPIGTSVLGLCREQAIGKVRGSVAQVPLQHRALSGLGRIGTGGGKRRPRHGDERSIPCALSILPCARGIICHGGLDEYVTAAR